MNGGIRLHHENNRAIEFFHCENRQCKYDKIDDAYSWEHVKVLGWLLKRADMWGGEKASGINKDLISSDGMPCEIYCPLCSEELRS